MVDTFRSADGGQSWTKNGALPAVDPRLVLQWDPVLAFDRTGTAYLAIVGALDSSSLVGWTVLFYRSTDNGATWSGVDVSKTTAGSADKPWLAIDNSGGAFDGSLYLGWYAFGSGSRQGMHVAHSRDHGLTWTESDVITAAGWPFVATGADGAVYASYYTSNRNFEVVRSDDGGVTFGTPSTIAPARVLPPNVTVFGTVAFQMAADVSPRSTRGNLYFTYPCDADDAGHPPSSVCFRRSLDGGTTWSVPVRLSSRLADAGLPSLAVDSTTGEVLMTWIDKQGASTNVRARLWAARSRDGGATFDPPEAFSSEFSAAKASGDYNESAAVAGSRLTMFSDDAGNLSVVRITWPSDTPPPSAGRRRAVRH